MSSSKNKIFSKLQTESIISPRSGVSPLLLMTTRWPIRTSRVILAGLILEILGVFVKLSFVNRWSAFDAWFFLRSFLRMWSGSNGMRRAQFENGGAFRDGRDLQVIIDTIILIAINILGKKHSEILTIFGLPLADLKFVKKFTRPNFRAKEFYTLKMRKSRLFSPAINSKNSSLSLIWPSFG